MFCQMSINRAWWNLTRVLKSLVRSIRTLVYLGNNSVTLAKATSVRFYSTTTFFARMDRAENSQRMPAENGDR